jgi:hypothetical protein
LNFPVAEMSGTVEARSFAGIGCGVTPGLPIDGKQVIQWPEQCYRWQADWRQATDQAATDIVVIMVGAWEIMDHQIDGRSVRFGSPEWDSLVRQGVEEAVTAVSGAKAVALLNVPCMQQSADAAIPSQARNDPQRQAALNTIIDQVAAERGAKVFDLRAFLCPTGEYAKTLDGVDMRFDGVHLTPEGAAKVWRWLVGQMAQVLPGG